MKFIEISEGVSVCKDKIESVTKTAEGTLIMTQSNRYLSVSPYTSILELLEMDQTSAKLDNIEKSLTVLRKSAQYFSV